MPVGRFRPLSRVRCWRGPPCGRRGRFPPPLWPYGEGALGLAGGLLLFCGLAELLPVRDSARRERDREDSDERGAMIRDKARARAGDVLLWLLLFGAVYLFFFAVPKWVNLTLLGLACVKLLLDWAFTAWYRRKF